MAGIAERTFGIGDQKAFSELSGDCNPLHMDPLFARRTIYGKPVVHGIHLLLWALDKWLGGREGMKQLVELKVTFNVPVFLDRLVSYSEVEDSKSETKIIINDGRMKSVQINASFIDSKNDFNKKLLPHSLEQLECRSLDVKEIASCTGKIDLYLDPKLVRGIFPNLIQHLSWLQISEIIATTRLVGMLCPGLHSIYSGMHLKFSSFSNVSVTPMTYRVNIYDERFSRVLIDVEAPGVQGTVIAFLRPPPKLQAAYHVLRDKVKHDEFLGQRAIIIGGSRGLGEVTAKLLAAGGASIRIAYYQGQKEAINVVDEIKLGCGKAESFAFDVLTPCKDLEHVFGCSWTPTHLYYFATPFIFSGSKSVFSAGLFDTFCDYYVKGFLNTVEVICGLGVKLEGIYYPSTVAINEVVTDMGEYCAAKTAGEFVCRFLEKKLKNVKIIVERLPRLATDQTASLLPVNNKDPVPVLLNALRRFYE